MFAKYAQTWYRGFVGSLLLVISLLITSCGSTPTPAPTPINVTFDLSPGPQVAEGEGVSISIVIEPYEELEWQWEVSGTSGGQLSSTTGEDVVYTAGKKGVDIIIAEAITQSGVTIRKKVSMNVVSTPLDNQVLIQPTQTIQPTVPPTAQPSTSLLTITTPQDGENVPCTNIARGTYSLDLDGYIWPIVLIDGRYHPQDEGGKAAQKNGGNWYQTVRFGDCKQLQNDSGKPFQLIIVTANESANAEIEKYLESTKASGKYPGLIELPAGTKEYMRIIVTRE